MDEAVAGELRKEKLSKSHEDGGNFKSVVSRVQKPITTIGLSKILSPRF